MNEERTIAWYVDRAIGNQGYSSDTKLDIALGYKGSFISYLRKGKALPSPDKMVELAKLAGVDPSIALMDLAIWNSQGEAKQHYQQILKKIVSVFALLLLAGICAAVPGDAQATTLQAFIVPMAAHSHSGTIHYHTFIIIRSGPHVIVIHGILTVRNYNE